MEPGYDKLETSNIGECDLLDPYACQSLMGEDDNDFQAFINREFGRAPLSQLSDSSAGNSSFAPELQSATESSLAKEKLAHLQDYGLRSSPASTNRRKRKYSSTGDLDHFPSSFSWDTDSSDDSELRRGTDIPASPHQQTRTTPLKRSASSVSSGVACTLMPFSLIKAFPSHNSLSLSEVNRRIQTVVENDAAAALRSQGSGSLTSPRLSGQPQPRLHFPSIRVDHGDSSQYSQSFASQPRFR